MAGQQDKVGTDTLLAELGRVLQQHLAGIVPQEAAVGGMVPETAVGGMELAYLKDTVVHLGTPLLGL